MTQRIDSLRTNVTCCLVFFSPTGIFSSSSSLGEMLHVCLWDLKFDLFTCSTPITRAKIRETFPSTSPSTPSCDRHRKDPPPAQRHSVALASSLTPMLSFSKAGKKKNQRLIMSLSQCEAGHGVLATLQCPVGKRHDFPQTSQVRQHIRPSGSRDRRFTASSRPAWSTYCVPGHMGKTVSKKSAQMKRPVWSP